MTSSPPVVSIIMNCYNSDRFLKEAIDSVYAQNFQAWEIIFWDNASTDSSAEIAKSYDDRVKYYLANETTPLGEARNLALKKAVGKYIAFLDCDDLYLPQKLDQQVILMEQGDYALSYSSVITIDEQGMELRRIPVSNSTGNLFGMLLNHYEINMQSVIIRHEVLINERLGFDSSMKYCPDYNLFMELALRYRFGVINDFLVKYRIVDNSLSRKTVGIASSEIRFTLDRLLALNPSLKHTFYKNIENAYAKLHYYDAVAAIYSNDREQARNQLLKVVFKRLPYLALYLLLWMPVSNNFILSLLRR